MPPSTITEIINSDLFDSLSPEAQDFLLGLDADLYISAGKNKAILARNDSPTEPAITGLNVNNKAKSHNPRIGRGSGVAGFSTMNGSCGVFGKNEGINSDGVRGVSKKGRGVMGYSEENIGVYGKSKNLAGKFDGNVAINGLLSCEYTGIYDYGLESSANVRFRKNLEVEENVVIKQTLDVTGLLTCRGDIELENADIAEEFDVSNEHRFHPGAVMVLDETGKMIPCSTPYDKKVVGIISGAGSYKPGITLDRVNTEYQRAPIALLGKAFCLVDSSYGSISVGDLLTTSSTEGHAMRVSDNHKSFGCVIGKALSSHKTGIGMIPVLIMMK